MVRVGSLSTTNTNQTWIQRTEKRVGARHLPVDGFHADSQTVFQFHGKLLLFG